MEPLKQVMEVLNARRQTCQLHRLGENHLAYLAAGIVMHFAQPLADAQATIAALQARVQELEEITKVICGHCCEPMEIPSKAVLQSQLTQRTAELAAANKQWTKTNAEYERVSKVHSKLQAELERVRGERDKLQSEVDGWELGSRGFP